MASCYLPQRSPVTIRSSLRGDCYMRLHSIALTLALAGFGVGIVPAVAADGPSVVVTSAADAHHHQTVNYGDLDVSNAQGAKILVRRITLAAKAVCETASGADLSGLQKRLDCERDTVKQTVASLNNPVVTSVYAG